MSAVKSPRTANADYAHDDAADVGVVGVVREIRWQPFGDELGCEGTKAALDAPASHVESVEGALLFQPLVAGLDGGAQRGALLVEPHRLELLLGLGRGEGGEVDMVEVDDGLVEIHQHDDLAPGPSTQEPILFGADAQVDAALAPDVAVEQVEAVLIANPIMGAAGDFDQLPVGHE